MTPEHEPNLVGLDPDTGVNVHGYWEDGTLHITGIYDADGSPYLPTSEVMSVEIPISNPGEWGIGPYGAEDLDSGDEYGETDDSGDDNEPV